MVTCIDGFQLRFVFIPQLLGLCQVGPDGVFPSLLLEAFGLKFADFHAEGEYLFLIGLQQTRLANSFQEDGVAIQNPEGFRKATFQMGGVAAIEEKGDLSIEIIQLIHRIRDGTHYPLIVGTVAQIYIE